MLTFWALDETLLLFAKPPRFVTVLIGLFMFLLCGAFSRAEAGTFKGDYYDNAGFVNGQNTDFTGLKFTRNDQYINFDWGSDGPQSDSTATGYMNPTSYSVRWTGWIDCPTTGDYTFEMRSDDGARLYLDNSSTALIPDWNAHPATTSSATVWLVQGAHRLKLEYFQSFAPYAEISLRWKVPGYVPVDNVLPPLVPAAETPIKMWSIETPLSGGELLLPNGAGVSTGTAENPLYLDESERLPFEFAQAIDMDRWKQGAVESDVERDSCGYVLNLLSLDGGSAGGWAPPGGGRIGSYGAPILSELQTYRRVKIIAEAYDSAYIAPGEEGTRNDPDVLTEFVVTVRQNVWKENTGIGLAPDANGSFAPDKVVANGRLVSPVDTRRTAAKPVYVAPGGIVPCQVETATDYDTLTYYPDTTHPDALIPDANYVWTTTRGTFRVQTGPDTYTFSTSVTGKRVYFVAPPATNGASVTATVKCTISDPFVVAKPDSGDRTDAPLIRTQQIVVPANTVELGMLVSSAPALTNGTKPEQFTPRTTVGGSVHPTAFVTVGQGMRIESDFGTLRLEELPDSTFTAAQQHSFETNHIDFYLCFYEAWGWEKLFDPDGRGPKVLDWWPSPEAPKFANSAAGPVQYRYRFSWNSSQLTPTPYVFPGQPTSTLPGHNGAHRLSYLCSDINPTKPQLDFTSNYGGSYLDGAPPVGLTVKNMVITNVSTNNGTSDYFKFNPTAASDSPLKNPTVNFTISDDTDSAGHVYRWRVRVRSTDIEDQSTSVVYEDIATQAGPVVVPINQARLAADNPPTTTGISDWGTYNFDMSIREYRSLAEAQSDLAQSTSTIVFDRNRIDMMSLRSTLLSIPYTMPSPDANLRGHDGEFLFNPDGSKDVDLVLSYYLKDGSRTRPTTAKAGNMKVEVIPPTLGNPIVSKLGMTSTLNAALKDQPVFHFDSGTIDLHSTYIVIMTATDDHNPDYREHKPRSILAKNKRLAAYEDEWDLNVWYDGYHPITSLSPTQISTMQTYWRSLYGKVGIDVNFMGTTTGTTIKTYQSAPALFDAYALSPSELATAGDPNGYHTCIINEMPSVGSSDSGHTVGTYHPYPLSVRQDWNGRPERPGLISIIFNGVDNVREGLLDMDGRPAVVGGGVGGDALLQYVANDVCHESYHCLAMTTNSGHCTTPTCINNRVAGGQFQGDMRSLNIVTFAADAGTTYMLKLPFHDGDGEVNRLLDRTNRDRK